MAIASFSLAAIVPVVVIGLCAVGLIERDQHYPHPAAWPTIFASAVLLTIGSNLVVWLRLTRRATFSATTIAIAFPLLAVGSFVAVFILVLSGYGIYFQIPAD